MFLFKCPLCQQDIHHRGLSIDNIYLQPNAPKVPGHPQVCDKCAQEYHRKTESPIVKFAREHWAGWNGCSPDIGWYLCVPMKVLAEAVGLTLDEFVDATAYYRGDSDENN